MKNLSAKLEKLRCEAEDCDLISGLATDINKREFFTKLAADLRTVANDLEVLLSVPRPEIL
jgi:hypothetical protein